MSELVKRQPPGHWVQTERAALEAWASLIEKAPKAAQLIHILTARVGEHNAVVVSQKTLAALMKCSRRTVQRAVDVLAEEDRKSTRLNSSHSCASLMPSSA